MAANEEVLKSFLISLGFKTDDTSLKKFTGGISNVTKGSVAAGSAIIGVAAAAEIMVRQFSSSMEKLYYASQRTGATVGNIQGIELGAQRAGIEAGKATGALEAMAKAIRTQPGMRGMMDKMLGKDTSAMDQTKAMLELVQHLANMPHAIGSKFAAMFGMDEETFLMVKKALPEINAAMERHNQLLKDAGIDADKAAEASKNYQNKLSELGESWDILKSKLSIALMPAFNVEVHALKELFNDISGSNLLREGKHESSGKIKYPDSVDPIEKNNEIYDRASKTYGIPAAMIKKQVQVESGGNPNAIGPVTKTGETAKGLMQTMGAMRKDYGITDPFNAEQSIMGGAHYMSDLKARYGGDMRQAYIAYNMGPAALERNHNVPYKAASDYADKIMGGVNIKTDIHVNGAGDPHAVAKDVLNGQSTVYANATRNSLARIN